MTQTRPHTDQRADERYGMALPITMEGEEGATHDVSAGGILFESGSPAEVGAQVALSLEYRRNGEEHRLRCEGEVVRVERHGDGYNLAVRLHAPLFAEAGARAVV